MQRRILTNLRLLDPEASEAAAGAVLVAGDRIEAGTWIMAAAMAGGDVRLEDVRLDHLGAVVDKLNDSGYRIG